MTSPISACPGLEIDEHGDPCGDCEGTPSRVAILQLPGPQYIETTLLVCETCAENPLFGFADSIQLYDWLPGVLRTVKLWHEAKGLPEPKHFNFPVVYRVQQAEFKQG